MRCGVFAKTHENSIFKGGRTMKSWLKITVIVLLTIAPMPVLGTSSKHALIIGNSAYKDVPLKNPVNDANDMASTLEQLGFAVLKKTNVDQQTIEQAFREFEQQLQTNDIALFYFSGHGIQIDGINYLLPIGADIHSADEIKYKAVNANMVLDKLQNAGTQLNIIMLDACRNNPFKQFRSLERGLAIMSASTGTIISYATAPGSVAYDGDERNSPYTKYLLKTMQIPGLEVEKVFKQVRVAVMTATQNKQVPWESSSLTGDFYFTSSEDSPITGDSPITRITLQGNVKTTETSVVLSMGERLKITATGKINMWQDNADFPKGTPNGNGLFCISPAHCLLDTAQVGALIGKIRQDGQWFFIGNEKIITAEQSGQLILAVNDRNCDGCWDDNKGYYDITIDKLR